MDIGDDEGELRAGVPAFGRLLRLGIVEIDGDGVIWWRVGITEGKEEDAPAGVRGA